jgi:tetrapyrrole methylase family protein/MazG family protein
MNEIASFVVKMRNKMQKFSEIVLCGIRSESPGLFEKIKKAQKVIFRGNQAFNWLTQNGVDSNKLVSFKHVSNLASPTFEREISDIKASKVSGDCVFYVTPISPIYSDELTHRMIEEFSPELISIHPGADNLSQIGLTSETPGYSPLVILDGLILKDCHHPPFTPAQAVLIYFPLDGCSPKNLVRLLLTQYPATHELHAMISDEAGEPTWRKILLEKIGQYHDSLEALFIPVLSRDASLENFQEVIARLRAPGGCPWDQKQTHASLRTYLLEETYEALDALDRNDLEGLKEELGDLVLQIALHAQIASEKGEFNMTDILSGINQKIIYRHPHVFKDWVVSGEQQVVQNWETLKGNERAANGSELEKGILDGVPLSFPALAQAQAIQERAARIGFDWPDIQPVLDKVQEEIEEVKSAKNEIDRAKELGDLLFSLVNLIRWYKIDAESTLRMTNRKFRKRFAYIENEARIKGTSLQNMTLSEMDALWEQAKDFDD